MLARRSQYSAGHRPGATSDNHSRHLRERVTDFQTRALTHDLRRRLHFPGGGKGPAYLLRGRWRLMGSAGRLGPARKIGKITEDV